MKIKHALIFLPAAAIAGIVLAQGPLTPPGAPAPVMKTLDQIEPRTPISSLPFIISQPGSYYFTRNLEAAPATFPTGGNGAIEINSGSVTLDLSGFTLSSTAALNLPAINVGNTAIPPRSILITNGTIRGNTTVVAAGTFPTRTWTVTPGGFRIGIEASAGFACEYSHLTVIGCRTLGVRAGSGSRIHDVTAEQNGSRGIEAGAQSGCSHCLAYQNGTEGIYATGAPVSHCHASSNGGAGIFVTEGAVSHCVSTDNFGHGVDMFSGVVNHCFVRQNGADGIEGGVVVAFCAASGNNRRNNGSVEIDSAGARTGNNPSP